MKGKWLKVLSSVLGIADIIIFFISFQATISKVVSATSPIAALAFLSIIALEFFRNRVIENIDLDKPPLNNTELEMRAIFPKRNIVNRLTSAKIAIWKAEKRERIQGINNKYLVWQKTLFVIGIIFTIITAVFLSIYG